jgi:transcriptional regulator with XRE-family HTH domain
MSVNEKLKLVRQAKGLTQEDVAEKLGISASTYGDIERGDRDPKLSKLQKIADILEIGLTELLDLTDKSSLNINFSTRDKGINQHVYINSTSEIEKQLLLESKDKEITLQREIITEKEQQILDLKKIIQLLEDKFAAKSSSLE